MMFDHFLQNDSLGSITADNELDVGVRRTNDWDHTSEQINSFAVNKTADYDDRNGIFAPFTWIRSETRCVDGIWND